MSKTKQKNKNASKTVFLNIDKIINSIDQEDVQVFKDAIDKEIGNSELDKEEIEQLQSILSVDALEAVKWKNVADVLRYINIFALAENNPEAMRKVSEVLLSIVGLFCPAVSSVNGILAKVPDGLFHALIKIGGLMAPEYHIYREVKAIADQKAEKVMDRNERDAATYEGMDTLIIVCKNQILSAELKKLVCSQDDLDDGTAVGTKDGTVHAMIWNEAAWEAFKDKLTCGEKVVIIGEIKNSYPLTPKEIRFEKHGVTYGWNKHIATITADPGVLSKKDAYDAFLSDMNTLKLAEQQKKNAKFKFDWFKAGKLAIFPPLLIGDLLREKTEIKKQQLIYGIYNFYTQDLTRFLNQEEIQPQLEPEEGYLAE